MNSILAPLDPDPYEWLHEGRIHFLQNALSCTAPLLEDIGLLDNVLKAWLIRELLIDTDDFFADDHSFQDILPESLSSSFINSNLCDKKQLSRLLEWARQKWGHRLETLYLNNQAKLDLVSCKLITVSNSNLAFELYCRLKGGEDTFDNISIKYGSGPERFKGGLFPLQPLDSFPRSMQSTLRHMKPGDYIKPFKYRGSFAIFQLNEWRPSTYDSHAQNQLLLWELESWQLAIMPSLKKHLELSPTSNL